MKIHESLPLVETILNARAEKIGSLFSAYKNHVYRVLHFSFALHECTDTDRQKLIIAGCFHDLGIWLSDWPRLVFDYLAPSAALAREYLDEQDLGAWSPEIAEMIDLHHKFCRVTSSRFPLVEVFRKADWVDATLGWRHFSLARAEIRKVQAAFTNLGFHRFLLEQAWAQWKRHPLSPLPMMKW